MWAQKNEFSNLAWTSAARESRALAGALCYRNYRFHYRRTPHLSHGLGLLIVAELDLVFDVVVDDVSVEGK